MKKTKKKKNLKLRRSIRKTIASLIMVMAIVVAAIPVENYGTMQAANGTNARTINLTYDSTAGGDLYKTTEYEDLYEGLEKTVQRIENSTFVDAYKIKLERDTSVSLRKAMITKYLSKQDVVNIASTEYYNYVKMDNAYIEAVKTMLATEKYIVNFTQTSATTTFAGDGNHSSVTINVYDFNTRDYDFNSTVSMGSDLKDNYGYSGENEYTTLTSILTRELVESFFKTTTGTQMLDVMKDVITNHNVEANKHISNLTKIQQKINDNISLSSTEDAQWNDAVQWVNGLKSNTNEGTNSNKYKISYDTTKKIYSYTLTIDSEIDNNANQLADIIEFSICNRFSHATTSTWKLDYFQLIKLYPEKDSTNPVYVPQRLGSSIYPNQIVDTNGYLVTGTVQITGIKSNAFNGSSPISEVSIPATVEFIGREAFKEQTSLKTVNFDDSACKIIGDRAFADCNALTSFNFTSNASALVKIGKEAFANTGEIQSIIVPQKVETIGVGCFYNSGINSLSFADKQSATLTLMPFSFFDCRKLIVNEFPTEKKFIIQKGAFAYTKTDVDEMTKFVFPKNMTAINQGSENDEDDYDYILAGRKNLLSVTFPGNLGKGGNEKVPDNTLRGCENLEIAIFTDEAYNADYNNGSGPDALFADVMKDNFVVQGPKEGTKNTKANTRTLTWTATIDQGKEELYQIPYQYVDSTGTHLEMGVEGKDQAGNSIPGAFYATIDVIGNTSTAVLTGYEVNTKDKIGSVALTIPPLVGNYTVIEIAQNCLGKDIKDKVYKIKISDGTVQKINASAFQNCESLQWVEIGNSVSYIGSLAFADCPKLENVVFSQVGQEDWKTDDSYWADLKIEDDAFKTGSQLLIFHGAINPNYRPYIIAKELGNKLTTGNEICYKTDEPLNLTVIKDRSTDKMTLIDYPHFSEIDIMNKNAIKEILKKITFVGTYSIKEKILHIGKITENPNYVTFDALESIEEKLLNQILNLDVPAGIESIDAKSFYASEDKNKESINLYCGYEYEDTDIEIKKNDLKREINGTNQDSSVVRDLYSKDEEGIHAGLFSGNFKEGIIGTNNDTGFVYSDSTPDSDKKVFRNKLYIEKKSIGNDYLKTVNLETIEYLPDYAFESAENLETVTISSSMNQMGKLPFKDCKTMYDVITTDSVQFECNKLLLFENPVSRSRSNETSGKTLVQCLEGRGNSEDKATYGDPKLKAEEFEGVSAIREGAFSDCDYIATVDLSESTVQTILKDTFKDCDNLDSVTFPRSISNIYGNAFSRDNEKSLTVVIPNENCVVAKDAFNSKITSLTIVGKQFINGKDGEYTPLYKSIEQVADTLGKDIDDIFDNKVDPHIVTFVSGVDRRVIKTMSVEDEQDASFPNESEIFQYNGKKFTGWYTVIDNSTLLTGQDTIKSVVQNRTIVADYKDDPETVISDGNSYTLTVTNGVAKYADEGKPTDKKSTFSDVKGGEYFYVEYTKTDDKVVSWVVKDSSGIEYPSSIVEVISDKIIKLKMQNTNITVTAQTASDISNGSSSGGSNSNGSNSGSSSDSSNKTKYKVTVNYGSGSGEYAEGDTVTISANTPDSTSKVFSKWTTDNTSVAFASATSSSTTFKMPASAVVVTANYKTKSSADDDDDEESRSSRRPTSSTTTVNTSTNNSANTANGTNTSTTTGTVSQSGEDKLYITKNGVSNKDVGSAQVDGSTDNFVVKISESAEATAAVEEALRNRYGSLDGLAYFPMDISLYDASGKNKIEDTYGLNVTVTMPIPDVLVQYGGNARAAAADNGYLTELNVRFTTIDGIACMSFVPPHFSPYVIYVDTNNLVAGQTTDATPKTGDPIHPKWFLAIGMAGLSVLLFVTGDTKKKRKVKMA